ncbi:MAG: hypothetical protein MN733_25355 [Nitrososphaera sp.]|nr:hypothetical protein [Nitrososphaera sp.]
MSNGQDDRARRIQEAQDFLNMQPSGAIIAQDGGISPDVARARQMLGMDPLISEPEDNGDGLTANRVGRFISNILPLFSPQTLTTRPALGQIAGAGAVETVTRSLAGLIELPAVVQQYIQDDDDVSLSFLTKKGQFLRATSDMFDAAARIIGQGAGLSDEQIADVNLTGELVGYVAPGLASWKAAGLVTFAGRRRAYAEALKEATRLGIPAPGKGAPLFVGNIIQDMAAGAIFAFGFEEGDLAQRASIAEVNVGLAMAFGVSIGASRLSFRGYRLLRLATDKNTRNLLKQIMESKDPLRGVITLTNLDRDTARLVNRQMTEEYFMSQTEGGIRLATQGANLNSLIQGVYDMAEGGASHGIIRDVVNGDNLPALMQSAKREFPDLTLTPVSRKGGKSADIIFGRGGISGPDMSEFNAMRTKFGDDLGMFPGQHFKKGETEYVFLGRDIGKRDQPLGSKIRAKRLTDNEIRFITMDNKVTPMFSATPQIPGSRASSVMIDDYIRWLDEKYDQILKARTSPGTQALDELDPQGSTLRDFPSPDSVVGVPDEAGLPPNGKPFLIEYDRRIPDTIPHSQELNEAILLGRPIFFHPIAPGVSTVEIAGRTIGQIDDDVIDSLISRGGTIDSKSGMYSNVDLDISSAAITRSAKRASRGEPGFQLTYFYTTPDGAQAPGGHLSHPTLDTLLKEAERLGFVPRNPDYVRVLLEGANQREILRQGLGDLQEPLERFDHSTLVNLWARDRGIPVGEGAAIPRDPLKARLGETARESLDREIRELGNELAEKGKNISPERQAEILSRLKLARQLRARPPTDIENFKVAVAERLRTQALDGLEPGERAIYKKLQDELETFIENQPADLKRQAAANGFWVSELDDGKILLRDIDSGTPIIYRDKLSALDGLQFAARDRRSFLDGYGLPPTGGGGGGYMGGINGGDIPDGEALEWLLPGVGLDTKINSKAVVRALRLIHRKPVYSVIDGALASIESGTGLRIWSQGFRPLLQAVETMDAEVLDFMNAIGKIFHGYSKKDVLHLFDYMKRIEGQNFTTKELAAIQREMGVDARLLKLNADYRKLFDSGFEIATQLGLTPRDYISDYLSRIRPMFETGFKDNAELLAALETGGPLSKRDKAWFLKARTGNLAQTEKDLRLIAIKYFRELMFERHVAPIWNNLYKFVEQHQHGPLKGTLKNPLGLNSLDPATREQVVKQLGGDGSVQVLVKMFEDVLHGVAGTGPKSDALTGFFGRFFKLLGVEVDDQVMQTYVNLALANQYGMAMGMRMRSIVRDSLQTMWFLSSRLGYKHFGSSLEIAMTMPGFTEAKQAGALQLRQSGVELGDLLFDAAVDALPIKVTGRIGPFTAIALRAGGAIAKRGRALSKWGLIPFSSLDEMMRAHAYWYQKLHTKEWITRTGIDRLLRTDIPTEELLKHASVIKFMDEGLPFFEHSKKLEFLRQMRGLNEEEALRYIGAQAANETHFVYKMMNQPGWVQTSWGKVANVFGTWPMNAREVYYRSLRNGTRKQRAQFIARTGLTMSAVGVLANSTGTNLWSWISPLAWLNYFGGPQVDTLADVGDVIGGSHLERAQAFNRLLTKTPFTFLPGFRATMDLAALEQGENSEHSFYIWALGRPQLPGPHYTMQYLMNPDKDVIPATFRNLAQARRRRTIQSQMLELPAAGRPAAPRSLQDALRSQGISPLGPPSTAVPQTLARPLTPSEAFQE